MGFFDDMVASLSRNIEVYEHFSVDAEYRFGHDGDHKCMGFITRICPSNKRDGKTIPYSFTMTCDELNTTASIRAKLYHDRQKITPEDLIEIGNELNMQFPYCPFFFDTNEGRGVVATVIFSSEHYPNGPDVDDGQFFMLPDARNQLSQFYEKLLKTSEAYIRHGCV